MTELSDKAAHALCRAYRIKWTPKRNLYIVAGKLGGNAWANRDRTLHASLDPAIDRRVRHLWELRDCGLLHELHSPWSADNYLTETGEVIRREYRKKLGYD